MNEHDKTRVKQIIKEIIYYDIIHLVLFLTVILLAAFLFFATLFSGKNWRETCQTYKLSKM